jgi:signal transduction histidine kinase
MNRSLTLKLVIAFLAVSLVGTVLLAVVTGRMTASEFGSFIQDQEQEALVRTLADYYRRQGSWDGASTVLQSGQMGGQFGMGPPAGAGGPGRGQGRNRTAVLDASGRVVVAGMGYQLGEQVPATVVESGAAIEVDGQRVGTIILTRGAPVVTAAGAAFLERINTLLVAAAAGATIIALLLAVLLARTLTRPLRDLTAATQAVARGDLGRTVEVPSQDELGDLAAAFNQMSNDLAQAQERRRQMTADIAHDLRTPISIIQGHAEALQDGVLPANAETFSLIHDEALRLKRMVEDLRTLSRAEAGELSLNRRPVNVRPWLQNLVEAHKPRAAQRQIKLQADIGGDGVVFIDPDRMMQALNNLVDNALRHTPRGGVVTVGATPGSGSAIRLFVQDSGPGIAAEDLPHLFERFYRGDKSRRRHEGGSGLGLAIARSIVEIHGGRIWAENTAGAGAVFTIALPTVS